MYLLDTNIFLEILLERENIQDCKKLLEKIDSEEVTAIVTSFTLHSIAVILERLKDIQAYKIFLETLININGLLFYSTNPDDEIKICEICKNLNLDFDDALQYFVAKKFNIKIVSFDKHYDEKGIERLTPKDIP